MNRRLSYLAAFLLLVIVSLDAIQGALFFVVDWRRVPAPLQPTSSSVAGTFTVRILRAVAALIAIRRPENPIGWLMLSTGIFENWRGRDGNDPSVDIAKDADQRF